VVPPPRRRPPSSPGCSPSPDGGGERRLARRLADVRHDRGAPPLALRPGASRRRTPRPPTRSVATTHASPLRPGASRRRTPRPPTGGVATTHASRPTGVSPVRTTAVPTGASPVGTRAVPGHLARRRTAPSGCSCVPAGGRRGRPESAGHGGTAKGERARGRPGAAQTTPAGGAWWRAEAGGGPASHGYAGFAALSVLAKTSGTGYSPSTKLRIATCLASMAWMDAASFTASSLFRLGMALR
jgi:hypothetical protein